LWSKVGLQSLHVRLAWVSKHNSDDILCGETFILCSLQCRIPRNRIVTMASACWSGDNGRVWINLLFHTISCEHQPNSNKTSHVSTALYWRSPVALTCLASTFWFNHVNRHLLLQVLRSIIESTVALTNHMSI
jgi:hypothetical protein